jgi:hypothetical protein
VPTVNKRVWARRAFQYGPHDLDRGQIFELMDSPRDEFLLSRGYLEIAPKEQQVRCGECGAEFVDHLMLRGHGDKRHQVRSDEEQQLFDRRQAAREDALAPIRTGA